jgi:hypothetical protein
VIRGTDNVVNQMMTPGTSTMLRARRRDVNVKPNRRLDRKSSRGMLYENEELRLRTININAEVERGNYGAQVNKWAGQITLCRLRWYDIQSVLFGE